MEAFEWVSSNAPELLERYPIVFTGHTRDDFLTDYQKHWADLFGEEGVMDGDEPPVDPWGGEYLYEQIWAP